MLRTIPGVQYQADQDSTGGSYGTGTPNIGGSFSGTNILAVDGVVSQRQGTPNIFSSVTTLDAIGEVKVLLNSYQAEYAGNGGPIVQVVTRGGGREFHGSGYEYIRNDALNANDFFNNRNGVRRPRYRYNTFGGTLGGPVYIPGHWNQSRTKMFAFYNLEQALISTPGSLNSYTMPTALERQGDFSQTLDVNGKVIPITDTLDRRAVPRQCDSQEPAEPERPGADEHPAAAQFLQPGDQRRQLQLPDPGSAEVAQAQPASAGSILSPPTRTASSSAARPGLRSSRATRWPAARARWASSPNATASRKTAWRRAIRTSSARP